MPSEKSQMNMHPALESKDTAVINLRAVPKNLHRALKIAAMDCNVSLETYIINLLAKDMGIK